MSVKGFLRFLTAGLAVACAAAPAFADAPVTITVAYAYGKIFRPIHADIAKEFNKLHPEIKVDLQSPAANYEDLVQRTLAGLNQDGAPDISFQAVNQIRQFVDAGQAMDLTPFTSADARWSAPHGYYPSMMDLGKFGGRQMAIPFAISTPILYYNADLFRKAGLDPERPPKTWPEVRAAAKNIQALGNEYGGIFYDYLISGNWGYQALLFSEGGAMMNADETRVTFADAPGKRAARLLRGFVDDGSMKDWTRAQGEQSFIAGRVGFYVSTTAWLKGVQDKARFDLRTALFPVGSTGLRSLPCGGNGAVIFTKDPKKAKAAYEYAMFAAGPVGTAIMVRNSGYMPQHEKGAENLKDFYEANPDFKTSIQQIPAIAKWYSFPGRNTLKIIDVIKNSLQSVVAGRTKPDAAMDSAAAEVTALLH
ncbi:MAG: ABC transporter substrate-binding protein [Rhodospirillaceae bacterium]